MGVIKDAIKDVVHGVEHAVGGVVHAVEHVAKKGFDVVKDAVGCVVHGVEDVGKAGLDLVTLHPLNAVKDLGNAVGDVVKGDVNAVKSGFHMVVDPVKDIVGSDVTAVKDIGVGVIAGGTGGLLLGDTAHAIAQGDQSDQPSADQLAQASSMFPQSDYSSPYLPSDPNGFGNYMPMSAAPQYSLNQLQSLPSQEGSMLTSAPPPSVEAYMASLSGSNPLSPYGG